MHGIGDASAAECLLEPHIEHLRHIDAVKPYLMRVYLLVPEAAGNGAGLFFELLTEQKDRVLVLFLACRTVKIEEHAPLVYIVKVEIVYRISAYRTVVAYVIIYELFGKIGVFLIAGYFRSTEQRGYHTAVNVVPCRRFSEFYLLNIPERSVRCGTVQQTLNVAFYLFVHSYSLISSPTL